MEKNPVLTQMFAKSSLKLLILNKQTIHSSPCSPSPQTLPHLVLRLKCPYCPMEQNPSHAKQIYF